MASENTAPQYLIDLTEMVTKLWVVTRERFDYAESLGMPYFFQASYRTRERTSEGVEIRHHKDKMMALGNERDGALSVVQQWSSVVNSEEPELRELIRLGLKGSELLKRYTNELELYVYQRPWIDEEQIGTRTIRVPVTKVQLLPAVESRRTHYNETFGRNGRINPAGNRETEYPLFLLGQVEQRDEEFKAEFLSMLQSSDVWQPYVEEIRQKLKNSPIPYKQLKVETLQQLEPLLRFSPLRSITTYDVNPLGGKLREYYRTRGILPT